MAELLLERDALAPLPPTAHPGAHPADAGLHGDPQGLDRIGRALADPIRRSILIGLLGGTRRPSELADDIGTSRSNLSNHLSCLRGCGLIHAERAGRHLHYGLVSTQFAAALRMLLDVATALPACDQPDTDRSAR